jgi:hypothetical protein
MKSHTLKLVFHPNKRTERKHLEHAAEQLKDLYKSVKGINLYRASGITEEMTLVEVRECLNDTVSALAGTNGQKRAYTAGGLLPSSTLSWLLDTKTYLPTKQAKWARVVRKLSKENSRPMKIAANKVRHEMLSRIRFIGRTVEMAGQLSSQVENTNSVLSMDIPKVAVQWDYGQFRAWEDASSKRKAA